jgi:uncharacterized pyridoxamine 5'-phosphate oxidase family protein
MKREEIIRYIQEAHFGYLATVDPEGAPHVRPMGIHSVYGDNLYFFTFATTRKVAELDRNRWVEVVWAKTDEQSQVRISGTVAIEDDKAVIQRFRKDNPIVAQMLPREAEHLFRLCRIEPKTVEFTEGLVPYSQIDWRTDGSAVGEITNAR